VPLKWYMRKIGITFDWRGARLSVMANIARAADKLGFDVAWVPEAWGLESFSSAAHILTVTSKISLGAGIVNVYSRSAALIAMGYATLNQIGPQRFILGLGVSGRALVEKWHGAQFKEPFTRVAEYLEVIKAAAGGAKLEYNGKVLRLSGFRLYTDPVTPPLKVYLAALGDRSLELASQLFDGAILTMYPSSKLHVAVDRVTGIKPDKTVHVFQPVALRCPDKTVGDPLQVAKTIVFYICSMGNYYYANLVRLGYGPEADRIRTLYLGGDRDAAVRAAEALLDELALVGTPSQVAHKIGSYPPQVVPALAFRAQSADDAAAATRIMRSVKDALGEAS
jgi:alkanesulfonate monooxygenase SsuD/methylene tetrahydromethanopterin reductase-like flavin-dependent oxidoreductase (luciferase family)